jgi:hypothetical protein
MRRSPLRNEKKSKGDRMRATRLALLALICAVPAMAQPLLTVAEARQDLDGDGLPDYSGQTVTIGATATCEGTLFSTGSGLSFYVQDTTAGINVYGSGLTLDIDAGDSLRITGEITQYNGLVEIKPDTEGDIEFLGSPGVPDAYQLVLNQGVSEGVEGLLLKLGDQSLQQWVTVAENPSFAGGGYNFTVWNGETAVAIRVNESTGISMSGIEPGVRLFLTGLGGQYDSEPPYDSGYQLLPRYPTDVEIFQPSIPNSFHLDLWDNPFSPRQGEQCHIEYGGPDDMRFTLIVFDRSGREVARLADSRFGGDVVMYDGRDDSDVKLPVGQYILLLEGVGSDGSRYTTTETLVVAERLN